MKNECHWAFVTVFYSLATLYNPLTMPPELVKAHAKLDALVDRAYGRAFANDAERVAHLFKLYAEAVGKS